MKEKKLKNYRRSELIDIIFELKKENNELLEKLTHCEQRNAFEEFKIANAGSIADAAIQINRIFEVAQKAADDYLNKVKKTFTNMEDDINIYSQKREI